MNENPLLETLPPNWVWTTLGDLGTVVSGGTPHTNEPQYWGNDIPWITPADLSNFKEKYILKGRRNITLAGLANSSAVLLPENSLLFSSRAPIGYIVINKTKMATNQGFKNLILTPSGNVDYLYYYLQSAKQLAINLASGTTFLELSAANFSKIPVPLAPLKEQEKIVSKIEELFTELQIAENSLKSSQKMLVGYKHQCLKEAFEGKSTFAWREKNIDTFTEEKGGFAKHDRPLLPTDWQWSKLKDVAKVIMGQSPKGSSYNNRGIGTPLINGPVEFGPTPFSITLLQRWTTQPTKLCEKDDLILCVRGSTTGRQNIAGFSACLGRGVAAIRAINVEQKFLDHYFNYSNKRIFEMGTGTTFPNVSQDQLLNFDIPVMSVDEQKQIIQEIEYKLTIAENLEKSIQNNLLKINLYRQTLLKKAFSGKLTSALPDDINANQVLRQVLSEKKIYADELLAIKQSTPYIKPTKMTLIEIIQESFKEKEFTYEELRESVGLSYEDIRNQLFGLLETQKLLSLTFDKKRELLVFKLVK